MKQDLHSQEEGQVIRVLVKDIGSKKVGLGREDVEDGMDVINETVLTQDNLRNGEDIDTDDAHNKTEVEIESKAVETGFQDLTDEENEEEQRGAGVNRGVGLEKNEDLEEMAKEESVEDAEKNKVLKKKTTKNVPLLGGTTKQKMMQIANKRPPSKVNTKQSNGVKQGAEQGSSNPKPPIIKP